jgi:cytochrome c peroxidase
MTMRQLKRWPSAAAIAAVSVLALGVGSLSFEDTALAKGGGPNGGLTSLKGIQAPLPDLTGIVTDKSWAVALGKALFWEANAGSDGQACASCHFHAGADSRVSNALDPDERAVPGDHTFQPTFAGAGGPNYTLTGADFPFHRLSNITDRNSTVTFDSNDVVSSAGTFDGTFVSTSRDGTERCTTRAADEFTYQGKDTRHVEPRNVPTVVNAVFTDRNFWDGRANNIFNGQNPFGPRDANATITVNDGHGHLSNEKLALKNSSLASQAVGPPGSNFEMSCSGRSFSDIGKKLASLKALSTQKVAADDSVLASLVSPSGKGLTITYHDMIQKAFAPKYWSDTMLPSGYTQTEANFSMFWGISIMLYEATLISDDSPFDRYMANGQKPVSGFGDLEKKGLDLFTSGNTDCAQCHSGPAFTKAALAINGDGPVSRMQMADGGIALYDTGFYNIGARPTQNDQGLGVGDGITGAQLAYARQYVDGVNLDGITVNPCGFEAQFVPCNVLPGDFGPLTQRVAVDGAMKVPSLRNIAQTAPYFHNGGEGTLAQVIEFYNRGGDSRTVPGGDTTGTGPLGEDTPSFTPTGSNLDPKMKKRSLSASDQAALVAFLQSLTDDRVRCHAAPFDNPELKLSNGVKTPLSTQTNEDGTTGAAENYITLAPIGKNGLGAKCASVSNVGSFDQLPATMRALSE